MPDQSGEECLDLKTDELSCGGCSHTCLGRNCMNGVGTEP
jgi:hypothetical protein